MHKTTKTCTFNPQENPARLDKFLFEIFPDYSRTYFHDLIEQGNVTVNNTIINQPSFKLKHESTITVTFPPVKQYNLTPAKVDFTIVDVQQDFIVINKPAGLVVHASESNKDEISLVNGLLYYFNELKDLLHDEQDYRPGIVHRIDRDTSGLMLVAKTHKGQLALSKMFHDRQIHKTYLALVDGHPEPQGSINLPIGRHITERHKMAPSGIGSRYALTHYKTLAYYEEQSLIGATIVTGRTHQIRVHCAAIGHPLMGDSTYGKPSHLVDRQALHAWRLSFTYDNIPYAYTQPLADDILNAIKKIRSK